MDSQNYPSERNSYYEPPAYGDPVKQPQQQQSAYYAPSPYDYSVNQPPPQQSPNYPPPYGYPTNQPPPQQTTNYSSSDPTRVTVYVVQRPTSYGNSRPQSGTGAQPPYSPPASTVNQQTSDHHTTNMENVEDNFGNSFADKAIRRAFIRKVYAILFVQLAITFGLVAIFVFIDSVREYVQENEAIYWTSYAVFLVSYCVLFCVRRRFPANIICLTIFTLTLAYMTGTISSFYETKSVFIALGICGGVCLFITFLCFFTKFDLTSCMGFVLVLAIVWMWFGFFCIWWYDDVLTIVYSALGACVLMLFMAIDTRIIVGGGKCEISPEEYIFGATMLYTDIIFLFLLLLGLGGKSR